MREDIRTYPAATKEGAYLAALSIVNTTGARAAVVDERQNRESLGRWIATNDPALIDCAERTSTVRIGYVIPD